MVPTTCSRPSKRASHAACAAGRQGINFVREGPLLLAVHQGVTNTHVLTILEGVGFLLLPALAWILAIVEVQGSRVRFTLVTIACSLCLRHHDLLQRLRADTCTPAGRPRVCAAHPTHSLVWPERGPRHRRHRVSVLLTRVPGPLCGAPRSDSWGAEQGSPRDSRHQGEHCRIGALGRRSEIGRLHPRALAEPKLRHLPRAPPVHGVPLHGSVLPHRVGSALRIVPFGLSRLRWVLLVLAVPSTLNGIRLAITGGPLVAYFSRGAALTLVVALQLLLLVDWTVRLRGMDPRIWSVRLSSGAARGAAAFLVALMIIPTVCALRWSTVIGDFRQTITQHQGVVPATDIPASPGSSYLWSWTNTTLSLILRSSSSNAVVENVGTTVIPFNIDLTERQISPAYRWSRSAP